jgi:hypothetical protein
LRFPGSCATLQCFTSTDLSYGGCFVH